MIQSLILTDYFSRILFGQRSTVRFLLSYGNIYCLCYKLRMVGIECIHHAFQFSLKSIVQKECRIGLK